MTPLLLLLLLLLSSFPTLLAIPLPVLISCGSQTNLSTFLSDRFFSAGVPAFVASPHFFPEPQHRTLRSFPPSSSGPVNCYSIPIPPSRVRLRLFTVYDNYDSRRRSPEFDVAVEGTLVFAWRRPWPGDSARAGAYSDVVVTVGDGVVDVCFRSVGGDAPVVGSIEVVGVERDAYGVGNVDWERFVLVDYGRVTCGSEMFQGGDELGRIWQSDVGFRAKGGKELSVLATGKRISGAGSSPEKFSSRVYQTAVTTAKDGEVVEYLLPVDAEMDYVLWLHFAEIDWKVDAAGQRVFDVVVDGVNATRVDVFGKVGGFAAFRLKHVVRNLTKASLSVRLVPVVGRPVISGIENYALVKLDPPTVPSQVTAMTALKDSLGIPTRMSWNGDPCSPNAWDAWEGVTCGRTTDGRNSVISKLDLSSQGLKGYISEKIHLLSNLVSLNLSSNSLQGSLPSQIGQESLVQLDLSGNKLSGSIPYSLGSSSLKLVLLNDNELEGKVPESLYSVGVHGGEIDLSGNKGLCGASPLPACYFFFAKGKLSGKGKIVIGLSCVVLCVIVIAIYLLWKRRTAGYNHVQQDSTSTSVKRNRYKRHKSMMHVEMETLN